MFACSAFLANLLFTSHFLFHVLLPPLTFSRLSLTHFSKCDWLRGTTNSSDLKPWFQCSLIGEEFKTVAATEKACDQPPTPWWTRTAFPSPSTFWQTNKSYSHYSARKKIELHVCHLNNPESCTAKTLEAKQWHPIIQEQHTIQSYEPVQELGSL